MKVTVERAELLKSLGHVHRVVERRNTIPILANVLVRADKAALSLKATDLDLEVIESIAAEVSPAGSTTVPAHMFYEIVRKLPEGSQVVLESSSDRAVLAIRAGRSRFTLQTLPESDFPDLAAGDMTHKFTLAAADLKRLIDKTQFAISTEETRYYLNGIYLHAAGSGKSHGAARGRDRRPPAGADRPAAAGRRQRHAGRDRAAQDRDRGAAADRGQRGRGRRRAVVGQDPLLDRRRGADLQADRRHLPGLPARDPERQRQGADGRQEGLRGRGRSRLDGVERARPRGQAVAHRGKLILSVTNPDSGSATEELEVEYDSDPLDIGFNSRYLLDIAAQLDGEVAVLRLADPGSPTLIQDKDAKGALYVLMPMRV